MAERWNRTHNVENFSVTYFYTIFRFLCILIIKGRKWQSWNLSVLDWTRNTSTRWYHTLIGLNFYRLEDSNLGFHGLSREWNLSAVLLPWPPIIISYNWFNVGDFNGHLSFLNSPWVLNFFLPWYRVCCLDLTTSLYNHHCEGKFDSVYFQIPGSCNCGLVVVFHPRTVLAQCCLT